MAFLRVIRACCATTLLLGSAPALPAPTETQVKAVFLFNFARFVDWPAMTYVGANAPFTVCVYGNDPFGTDLDAAMRGETVDGRSMVVRRLHALSELTQCQIVFIANSADRELESVVAALDRRATLTVSDLEGAAQRGVMVRMVTENGKIRLRVNIDAVRAARITISSNLLRAAEIVGSAPPGDKT